MAMFSSADDSSLEALEALLTFRHGITTYTSSSPRVHPEIPVPDPLNPLLPHVIEGDSTPLHGNDKRLGVIQLPMPNRLSVSHDVPSVPNPLALMASNSASATSMHHQSTSAVEQKFSFSSDRVSSGVDAAPRHADAAKPPVNVTDGKDDVRADKIRDALNSRPQRGKKRGNLNDRERLELTRTRNREHAKCTR
jgi:hypothetical protein